jgi:hypothetical protein
MKNALLITVLIAAGAYAQIAAADYTVTCESTSGQTRHCPLNSDGRVYLQTQLSRAGCYEGQSWGTYDNSVWVSNGCRATFRVSQNNYNSHRDHYDSSDSSSNGKAAAAAAAVIIGAVAIAAANDKNKNHGSYSQDHYDDRYGQNYSNYGNNYGNRSVTCESLDSRRQRCATHIGRDSVQIARRLSKAGCRFGQDWNYDSNAIYVWNGCRAVFSIN